jgi:hypothetical protein
MINIDDKKKEFEYYTRALLGYYNDNLTKLSLDATEDIFRLTKEYNNQIQEINIKNINTGKFYLIKYNYNGNYVYCPIFTLEYKVINNKNVIYAINLDYLPYLYKMKFFNIIISKFRDLYDKHFDLNDVQNEVPFKDINFEVIYKLLQNNGNYEYSITAFDILKIKTIYSISTTILYKFIFIHTRFINIEAIKERLKLKDDDINILFF